MFRSKWLVFFVACAVFAATSAFAKEPFDQDYKALAEVLAKRVKNGRVNYAALYLDRKPLDEVVKAFGKLDEKEFSAFTLDQKRAFWINAFNAFVLRVVIDNYPVKPGKTYSKFPDNSPMNIKGAWNDVRFKSPVGKVTLNQIENNILPSLGQPYFVFAVSNGTKGGGELASEPYLARDLDARLMEAADGFLKNPENVQVIQNGKVLQLSRYLRQHGQKFIPKFFQPEQFRKRGKMEVALLNLLLKHGDKELASTIRLNRFSFRWREMDWSLNDAL